MIKTILSLSLLLAVCLGSTSVRAQVSVGVSINIAPPEIPVYEQPPCPVEGYIWIPGYWAYDDGYYWVPGYWEAPPQVGYYWTPGYWAFTGGVYRWHIGYWGPHVGYYGGINYGCGYGGSGYYGGEWYNGRFRYNTAVTRVNTTVVRNVYVNKTVVRNVTVNRVSYNGGPNGVVYRANSREQAAARDRHIQVTAQQREHQQAARSDRGQFASVNNGRPGNVAVSRPISRPAASRPVPARPVSRPETRPAPAAPAPRPAPPVNRPAPAAPRPQPQMHNQPRPQQPRPQQQARPQQPRPQQPQRQQPQRQQPQRPPGGGGEHPEHRHN